jgi:hypothetical protein
VTAYRKAMVMRKRKYCDQETVFEHIWNNADGSGFWEGDATTLAAELGATEDEAHESLGELCDRGFIEKVYPGNFAIVNWRERDDRDDEEQRC